MIIPNLITNTIALIPKDKITKVTKVQTSVIVGTTKPINDFTAIIYLWMYSEISKYLNI